MSTADSAAPADPGAAGPAVEGLSEEDLALAVSAQAASEDFLILTWLGLFAHTNDPICLSLLRIFHTICPQPKTACLIVSLLNWLLS